MITDSRAEEAITAIIKYGPLYAQAKANRQYLEEFRKSKKALEMKEAEADGYKTAVLQEREAYAGSEYRELLQGLKAAIEEEVTLLWKLTSAELTVDVWKTQSVNARRENKVTL